MLTKGLYAPIDCVPEGSCAFRLTLQYLEKSQKLYDRRSQIIHGTSKPTKEEIEEGEKEFSEIEEEYEPLPTDSTESAPIEHFWLTALRNHLGINELITDRDEAALKHLTDVTISYLPKTENRLGYKLSFHFSENEFFEDKVLEKTYIYKPDIDVSGDFIYERALGTQIKWKEDKDLTKEVEVKKQRNKSECFACRAAVSMLSVWLLDTNRTRLVRKARPVESFFNFFNPPVPPPSDVAPEDDLDEEEMEELDDRLALDYQIGDDFKDRVRMTTFYSLSAETEMVSRLSLVPSTTLPAERSNGMQKSGRVVMRMTRRTILMMAMAMRTTRTTKYVRFSPLSHATAT